MYLDPCEICGRPLLVNHRCSAAALRREDSRYPISEPEEAEETQRSVDDRLREAESMTRAIEE